ncbi:MAG: hypothetical protein JST55_09675 [Bacteroidetes bacterium]|nr:hypothetical protein [Bacteroidota bacterium]
MEQTEKSKAGVGVPDGDGGSIEREDSVELENENLSDDTSEDTDDEDVNPAEDEGDWDENPAVAQKQNSLGFDSSNRRNNESIEGAMNNPGVRVSGGDSFSMLKYFNIEFHDVEDGNRTIGCEASVSDRGYYFKGE